MRIIAVDDEKIALEALSNAIKAVVAEDEVISFRYPEDAVEYVKENLCHCWPVLPFLEYGQTGPVQLGKLPLLPPTDVPWQKK